MFLTKRQSQLLDHLRTCIAVQGYAPSLVEFAAQFELSSVGTVHKHLKALEDKGFIRRQWNRSRAIEIVEPSDGRARRVPVVGWLQGGHPIERMQSSSSVAVPEELTGREATVVLQVRGRSLRDECLDDGDYVVIARREHIRDGETAVLVLADGSTQVKLLQHRGDNVLLHSRRNGGAPLSVPKQDLKVEGVVVGILRRMSPVV